MERNDFTWCRSSRYLLICIVRHMNLRWLAEWESETVWRLLDAVRWMRFDVTTAHVRAAIALDVLENVFNAQIRWQVLSVAAQYADQLLLTVLMLDDVRIVRRFVRLLLWRRSVEVATIRVDRLIVVAILMLRH